jgi:hypothetical protein
MERPQLFESTLINNLIDLTNSDDRLKELSLDAKEAYKGTWVLELRQGKELVHKATYSSEDQMQSVFPRTLLYLISMGFESIVNKRK